MAVNDQDTQADADAPDEPVCTPDMGSCLRIDLGAIVANWRIVGSRATSGVTHP